MGGFLMVGILVAFLAGLGPVFFEMPGLSLAVSAMFVLLMSGLTRTRPTPSSTAGDQLHYGHRYPVVAIFNLFTSLLYLLGFMNRDE